MCDEMFQCQMRKPVCQQVLEQPMIDKYMNDFDEEKLLKEHEQVDSEQELQRE
jgi:hypothetical protein